MSKIIIVSIHSFVDIMTNSSSELFVCNTNKSVEQVKASIEEILEKYWQSTKQPSLDVWTEVFNQPKIAQVAITQEMIEEYKALEVSDIEFYAWRDALQEKVAKEHPNWSKSEIVDETYFKMDSKRLESHKAQHAYLASLDSETAYCLEWGRPCNKHDIILDTVEDNTLPYEVFETIEDLLGAARCHLG